MKKSVLKAALLVVMSLCIGAVQAEDENTNGNSNSYTNCGNDVNNKAIDCDRVVGSPTPISEPDMLGLLGIGMGLTVFFSTRKKK